MKIIQNKHSKIVPALFYEQTVTVSQCICKLDIKKAEHLTCYWIYQLGSNAANSPLTSLRSSLSLVLTQNTVLTGSLLLGESWNVVYNDEIISMYDFSLNSRPRHYCVRMSLTSSSALVRHEQGIMGVEVLENEQKKAEHMYSYVKWYNLLAYGCHKVLFTNRNSSKSLLAKYPFVHHFCCKHQQTYHS